MAKQLDVTSLSQDELDAITYDVYYTKEDTFDDKKFEKHLPLDNGKHRLNPTTNLGQLDLLPDELLSNVLMRVDLQCLTDFRQVSQRAMGVIDSMLPYAALTKHAPNSIRAYLSVGTAKLISCQDLYNKLIDYRCDWCGKFGGFLYLITCKRSCLGCVLDTWDYLPLSMPEAEIVFGLTPTQVQCLPHMRTRPGYYSSDCEGITSVNTLYDHESARSAGIAAYGSEEAMDTHLAQAADERLARWERAILDGGYSLGKPPPRKPETASSTLQSLTRSPRQLAALVRFPQLSTSGMKLEWGFWCELTVSNIISMIVLGEILPSSPYL